MKIIKSEIIDYLNRLRYLENKYSNFEENTIYEIWVENLDVDRESKEEEMLGIIYDNKAAGPPRLERGTSVLETDVLPLKLWTPNPRYFIFSDISPKANLISAWSEAKENI